jgi:hypothetical protein
MRLVLTGRQDVDREELDELTLQLRERLLELDVDDVEPNRSGDIPTEPSRWTRSPSAPSS